MSNNIISQIPPLKIIIKGQYYDCQIYRGKLYLWTLNGDIEIYDWNKLINRFVIPMFSEHIPFVFAFMEGNFLYDKKVSYIFSDLLYRKLLFNQYKALESKLIEISDKALEDTLLYKNNVPMGELPIDTEIYANNVYFALDSGLYRKVLHSSETEPALGPKDTKLWDNRILTLKANKYPQIALSAGSDGLFELNMVKESVLKPKLLEEIDNTKLYKVSEKASSFSNYSFLSLFSSSYVDDSFIALFNWKSFSSPKEKKVYREFEKFIEEKEIFGIQNQDELSWGIDDKIYRINNDKLIIYKFNNSPNLKKGETYYSFLKEINLPSNMGLPISVGTTYFGVILEFTNGILVLRSDGYTTVIPEEVIRWRVYPRSKNYLNHLHLIFNDRLEIYSFNHDVLMNQQTKKVGLEYIPDDQPSYMKVNKNYVEENFISNRDSQNGDFDEFNIEGVDLPF